MSDLGKQHTPNGAVAFASYFFRALDWGFATSDMYLLSAISLDSCQACGSYVRQIDDIVADGGHVTGGRITIVSAGTFAGSSEIKADQIIQLSLDQQPIVVVRSSVPPATQPAEDNSSTRLYVDWTQAGWRAVEIGGT